MDIESSISPYFPLKPQPGNGTTHPDFAAQGMTRTVPSAGSCVPHTVWRVSSLKVLALTIRGGKGVKKLPAPEQVFVDLGQLRFGANVIPVGFNNGF